MSASLPRYGRTLQVTNRGGLLRSWQHHDRGHESLFSAGPTMSEKVIHGPVHSVTGFRSNGGRPKSPWQSEFTRWPIRTALLIRCPWLRRWQKKSCRRGCVVSRHLCWRELWKRPNSLRQPVNLADGLTGVTICSPSPPRISDKSGRPIKSIVVLTAFVAGGRLRRPVIQSRRPVIRRRGFI